MPRYWEIMFRVRPTVGYSPDSPHKYIMDQLYIDLIAHNYRAVSEEIKKKVKYDARCDVYARMWAALK